LENSEWGAWVLEKDSYEFGKQLMGTLVLERGSYEFGKQLMGTLVLERMLLR